MLETRLTLETVRTYRSAGHWRDHVLHDYVLARAREDPDAPAVVDGAVRLTYGELVRLADRVALGLLELGVRKGDVVGVQLPNWYEFAVLLLAIERAGAVMNPLTPILRHRELSQMLRIAEAKLLVVPEEFGGFSYSRMATDLKAEVPGLQVVTVRGSAPPGAHPWEFLAGNPWEQRIDLRVLEYLRPDADDVTELAFTSGTTGVPKGVLHTHNSALCTVGSTIRRQALGPGDVFHVATPVGHNAGYFYGIRVALQSGGMTVFQDRWDPGEMARLVEEHRVTFTMGPTTFLVDLLQSGAFDREGMGSLRVFTCGGAAIPPAIAEEVERRLPGRLCPVFGMTEMGHVTAVDASSPRAKALGSDGSPQPEMEIKVVDESGRRLPPRSEGRLRFRGPFLFAGYIQGRDFTAPYFDEEGFFDTGDLAYADEDGYIRITGRVKDLIIRGGENVPVREIEDLLAAHPRIEAAALVAVPDPRLGERAVACVRTRGGQPLSLAEITAFLAEHHVTRQFWPEGVEHFDTFPMTPAGKIQKFLLQEEVLRRRGGVG